MSEVRDRSCDKFDVFEKKYSNWLENECTFSHNPERILNMETDENHNEEAWNQCGWTDNGESLDIVLFDGNPSPEKVIDVLHDDDDRNEDEVSGDSHGDLSDFDMYTTDESDEERCNVTRNLAHPDPSVFQVNRGGRPVVDYEDSSARTRRREDLAMALELPRQASFEIVRKKMRYEGNTSGARLICQITDSERASEIMDLITKEPVIERTIPKAVGLLIDLNLTRQQYINLRKMNREDGHKWLPPYYKVVEGKKDAYLDDINVSETSAEVSVQGLTFHTFKRLLQYLLDTGQITHDDLMNAILIFIIEYGFDGTHVEAYNQISSDCNYDYSHIFCSYMVPSKLVDANTNRVIWENQTPNSVRFCRPIRFKFVKETDEICIDASRYLGNQIDELQPFIFENCEVNFQFILSMIDGKVCNALNKSNSQKCFVCGVTIKYFNNIDYVINKAVDEENLKGGFTILHAWIRFMELVLNISIRLVLPKPVWRIPAILKPTTKEQGLKIQKALKNRIRITVNKPKQGFGNSNSGNTARIFSRNLDVVAEETGFDANLLHRFHVTLFVIPCGEEVRTEEFRQYNHETAREFVRLYPWFEMPTTMHLILIHGHILIRKNHSAIGLCSEEPLESSHKVLKSFREHHARKSDRVLTNTDVFRRLLLHSDPLISSYTAKKPHVKRTLTDEMKSLLNLEPDEDKIDSAIDSNSESEEEQSESGDSCVESGPSDYTDVMSDDGASSEDEDGLEYEFNCQDFDNSS
ncbi:hypothetical protein QAD02_012654 [Eretmocerus hayati]|uniref:Uncharacterized protein n=1 Tax=Eretmocerus hayati TaxID=131215 RepID=A0ACC2P0I9_9HYME|nr:hypothetical protein QAD02_012654 [Eretmocerus hayati]